MFIIGNTISYTSLTGQLVFIDCAKNESTQSLIFAKNTVSYLHGYMGTVVLKFIRYFLYSNKARDGSIVLNQHESLDASSFQSYAIFSGGITLQDNIFSHIVGCTTVDTTVFNIAVAIYDPLLTYNFPSFSRSIILPNNQYFYDS